MGLFSIYGVKLRCDFDLPGLISLPESIPLVSNNSDTVEITVGDKPDWVLEVSPRSEEVYFLSDAFYPDGKRVLTITEIEDGAYYHFIYGNGMEFMLDGRGNRVWGSYPKPTSEEIFKVLLLSPVLGFILKLRDVILLHASAIVVNKQAVLFVGPSGAGKSTTAAAFAKLGYPVLSDDLVVLIPNETSENYLVQPGYSYLRLLPESVQALYGSKEDLPAFGPMRAGQDKNHLNLTQPGYYFQQQPVPLGAIYLLGKRASNNTSTKIAEVPASTGLLTLIINNYAAFTETQEMRAKEFEVLGTVIKQVPVRKVVAVNDPSQLPQFCQAILEDFERLSSPTVFA